MKLTVLVIAVLLVSVALTTASVVKADGAAEVRERRDAGEDVQAKKESNKGKRGGGAQNQAGISGGKFDNMN